MWLEESYGYDKCMELWRERAGLHNGISRRKPHVQGGPGARCIRERLGRPKDPLKPAGMVGGDDLHPGLPRKGEGQVVSGAPDGTGLGEAAEKKNPRPSKAAE